MNQQKILEYNKRCAKFLNRDDLLTKWERRELNLNLYKDKIPLSNINILHPEPNEKFHSDWNWIMEVIEAIEKLNYIVIITTSPTISERWTLYRISIQENKISSVFNNKFIINYESNYNNNETKKEAVVEVINQFLIWHEQNN
jgi:hypothetical protein